MAKCMSNERKSTIPKVMGFAEVSFKYDITIWPGLIVTITNDISWKILGLCQKNFWFFADEWRGLTAMTASFVGRTIDQSY